MASVFGHMAVAYAMGKTLNPEWASTRFWVLTVLCCILPDVDVVGLVIGIPYEHVLGHRGITHSIAFAMLVGMVAPKLVVPSLSWSSGRYGIFAMYFGLVTLSHGILDACTNGGLGIAFFTPFDTKRYFFPWRPITSLPSVWRSISSWSLVVLLSERVWIGMPVGVWLLGQRVKRWKG